MKQLKARRGSAHSPAAANRLAGLTRPSDLNDWAYQTIKRMILDMDFAAGEQLPIETLAESMKISRTPIREALLRLESEELVRAEPRVGFFVRGITKQDLRELFELRRITEGYAAEKASQRLSAEDFAHLERLQSDSERSVAVEDMERFTQAEIGLHSLILNSANNRRLLKMIETIRDLTHSERMLAVRSSDDAQKALCLENLKSSIQEHRRIVDALRRRDGEQAGEAMREHIRAVQGRLLEFLDLPEEETR